MKNIKILSLLFSAVFIFSQCSETEEGSIFTGSQVHFVNGTSTSLYVFDGTANVVSPDLLPVTMLGTAPTSDVTVTVAVVDSLTTAIEGTHYNLLSNTVTISAGEYSGNIQLEGIVDGFNGDPNDQRTIVFVITDASIDIASNLSLLEHTIGITCPSDIVSTTYTLATNVTSTCCDLTLGIQPGGELGLTGIEIISDGNGNYTVPDVLGGHIVPFGFDPQPVIVTDICGNYSFVSGTGSLDYTGAGSGVTINEDTGVWTITFNNEGNAIAGVATLTPE